MKLRSHLVLLVLAATVPLVIFMLVVVRQHVDQRRDILKEGMRSTSRALSLAVDREVRTSWAVLATLAGSPLIDAGDMKRFHELCRTTVATSTGAWIILFDRSGQQIVNTNRPFGSALPNPIREARPPQTDVRYPDLPVGGAAPVKKVIDTGQPVVSDVFISLLSGGPRIGLDYPVIRQGVVRYVLEISVDVQSFTSLLAEQRPSADATAMILDARNIIVGRIPNAERFVGRRPRPELTALTVTANEGFGTDRTLEDVPVYRAFTRSAVTGWTVALSVPRAAADAPIQRSIVLLLAGASILLALGVAAAVLIGKRMSTPISALARSADRLARGERAEVIPPTVDEVSALHDALVKAGEAVRSAGAEREARLVAEVKRGEAERLSERLRRIQSVMDVALREISVDVLTRQLLASVRVALASDTATLLVLDQDGRYLRPVSSEGLHDEVIEDIRIPIGTGVAGKIATSDSGLIFDDLSSVDVVSPFLRDRVKSVAGAPLRLGDRVVGVIHVGAAMPRRFTEDDLTLLRLVAERVAVAIERARIYEAAQSARAEAEAANRMKDEFLAVLSHELRMPLTSIIGWARMLRVASLDEATRIRALDVIERSANVQTRLVNDMLDVARFMRGDVQLDAGRVDLAPVVTGAVDATRASAEAKRLTVEPVLDATVAVLGDPNRLQQIVGNLLTNAIKFTPAGGRIMIRLEHYDGAARIVVTDTGQGISAIFLPHVFETFRQGRGGREHGGLGLGLAIVQRLVGLHGGTVRAESPGEGQGATFTVTLPLVDP